MSCFGLRYTSTPSLRRGSRIWKLRRSCVVTWGVGHLGLPSTFATSTKDVRRERLERFLVVNAAEERNDDAFKGDYIEAVIDNVAKKKDCGVLDFRLMDGKNSILPMFIGIFEATSLIDFISNKDKDRPMTHDLMRNSLRVLGFEVTRIHVTALVGCTYHARVFFRPSSGGEEVSVDSRPSDATNLAVRFNAPIFVHREVAKEMAMSGAGAKMRSEMDVLRACKEEMELHSDPTVELKVRLQVAVAEEKYTTAAKLRDEIEKLLSTDKVLSLVVALESALSGQRYEEALQIREKLRSLRLDPEGSEKQESHG